MGIRENLTAIRDRMNRAAQRAGRNPADIALMAVTKTFPADAILEAYAAGHRLFGENRVQEFGEKFAALGSAERCFDFHMIGHLQSNENRQGGRASSMPSTRLIQSRLAARLNTSAARNWARNSTC